MHWLILGLDTGYHSGGFVLLQAIPWINTLPFLNVDAHFDKLMLQWLQHVLSTLQPAGAPRKSILVLTHHQPMSSFEHAYPRPAKHLDQLEAFPKQDFVWLYGHEHRLTLYNRQPLAPNLNTYPRCIGHAGMPVSTSSLAQPDPRILYYDPRQHPIDNRDPNSCVGFNGHLELLLDGPTLRIEYHDIQHNRLLLTESFTADGAGGFVHTHTQPPLGTYVSGTTAVSLPCNA